MTDLDGQMIQELHPGDRRRALHEVDDGIDGVSYGREGDDGGGLALCLGMETHRGLSYDAQGALGTNKHLGQIVAGGGLL